MYVNAAALTMSYNDFKMLFKCSKYSVTNLFKCSKYSVANLGPEKVQDFCRVQATVSV